MKPASKLFILILTFLALAASAYAQSPREELKQMVEQLQKAPNDNALREKIIKLATSSKPAPAIPEEAREPFVMGATVLKKASDPAGAGKAVELFTQALTIAPWFAEAYYNRALARETAGQFEPAIDDLKLYLEFTLTAAERREAQDKIYSLKADAQLASAKKAEAAKAEREKAGFTALVGTWLGVDTESDPRDWRGLRERTRYPDSVMFRYRFVLRGEDKALLYVDQHGGKWDHTPEDFWYPVYTGTRTSAGWEWTTRGANSLCGQNQVVRTVPFEVLEQGRVIRTRGISPVQQSSPAIGLKGYSTSAGPAGCVVVEYPMMLIRVSD